MARHFLELNGSSIRAKLSLSAVANAIIQQLLDQGYKAQAIFENGKFTIK